MLDFTICYRFINAHCFRIAHLTAAALLAVGSCLLTAPAAHAASTAPLAQKAGDGTDGLPPSLSWLPAKQGRFVTCLCEGTDHRIWFGTEDVGVWSYDPASKS